MSGSGGLLRVEGITDISQALINIQRALSSLLQTSSGSGGGSGDSDFVPIAGNVTMTGPLTLSGDPPAGSQQAATAHYVDIKTAGSGGSLGNPGWRQNADGTIENWAFVTTSASGIGTFTFARPYPAQVFVISALCASTFPNNFMVQAGTPALGSVQIYTTAGGTGAACGVMCRAIGH